MMNGSTFDEHNGVFKDARGPALGVFFGIAINHIDSMHSIATG
jgi:hypothetical protein